MVKTCIICKKESTFLNQGRSFHKFPRDEKLKEDWMHATGLSVVAKTAVICSDHFDPNAFHDTDGYTRIKRLLSNAVPQKTNVNPQITNNYPHSVLTDVFDSNTTITNTNTTSVQLTNETKHTVYPLTQSTNAVSNSTRCTENILAGSSNTKSDNILAAVSCEDFSEGETAVTVSNSANRKHSVVDVQPAKKIRFTTGFKTEYISRKDFISDEAWERFKRFNTYKSKKIRTAHSRNLRKEKKISIIKAIVNHLKKNQFSDSADYLEDN